MVREMGHRACLPMKAGSDGVMSMLVHGTCPVLHAILLGRRRMKVAIVVDLARWRLHGYLHLLHNQPPSPPIPGERNLDVLNVRAAHQLP